MANIFKKAKSLRSAHPKKYKTFRQAVKAAGQLMKKQKGKKKKSVGSVKRSRTRRNTVNVVMGTVSSLKSQLSKKLTERIDNAVVRRHHATKKTDKKKLTRTIAALEREKRKFC